MGPFINFESANFELRIVKNALSENEGADDPPYFNS